MSICYNGTITCELFGEKCWKHLFINSVRLFVLLSLIFTVSAHGKCLDFEKNFGQGWIDCDTPERILDSLPSGWKVDTSQSHGGSSSLMAKTTGFEEVSICREVVVDEPTNVNFWWKLSDEGGRFVFRVDGVYRYGLLESSGESRNWGMVSHTISDTGTHKLEWVFFGTRPDSRCQFGWIDDICVDTGDESPTIILESPQDNATSYVDENVDFSYIPNDDQEIVSCILLIDKAEKDRNESPKNGTTNALSYNFDTPGKYEWCITCCDNASQCTSISRNITIEDPRPMVSLEAPINGSQSYIGRKIEFRYKPLDNKVPENCTLIIDEIEQNEKRDYQIENNAINVFDYSFDEPGDHSWCVRCYDSLSQDNTMEIRSISILPDEDPTVELKSPENSAVFYADENISFEYRASDDKKLKNCTLIIDGKPVKVESSPKNGSADNFSYRFAETQMADDIVTYNWTIVCYDNRSKRNDIEEIRNLSVRIDKTPVVLVKPIEVAYVNRTVSLEYVANDDKGIKKCILLIDGKVCDNISKNASVGSFNRSFPQEGNYTWNVTCWDSKDRFNFSDSLISIERPHILFVNQQNPNETEYQKISDAIRDIAHGGTIYVKPGQPYYENIIIDKNISLVGLHESEKPKIIGDYIPIKIASGNVSIEGFEVEGSSRFAGIYMETNITDKYSNISIHKNKIINSDQYCICLYGRNSRIYDINVTENDVDGCDQVGVYLYNCEIANVSDNRVNCDENYRIWCREDVYLVNCNPESVIIKNNTCIKCI